MTTLVSPANPKIKQIRALRQRKARQESGLFVVEGIRPVGEAIAAGAPLAYLVYAPEFLDSDYARQLIHRQQEDGLAVYAVAAKVFQSLADKDNPQGILAVVHQRPLRLDTLNPETFPWGVALVAAQDPGNVGTILRSADAVGASGLLLLDGGADVYHPSAVRASMGTLFWQKVAYASFGEFAAWAKQHGYHVYGTSARGSVSYHQVAAYRRPMILLMGSERHGLDEAQRAVCELLISLPMHGHASSLNLAVATGVMLYEMLRKSPANEA